MQKKNPAYPLNGTNEKSNSDPMDKSISDKYAYRAGRATEFYEGAGHFKVKASRVNTVVLKKLGPDDVDIKAITVDAGQSSYSNLEIRVKKTGETITFTQNLEGLFRYELFFVRFRPRELCYHEYVWSKEPKEYLDDPGDEDVLYGGDSDEVISYLSGSRSQEALAARRRRMRSNGPKAQRRPGPHRPKPRTAICGW